MAHVPPPIPALSPSTSSSVSIRSFSSFYSTKTLVSIRLFSSNKQHRHWGFYKLFSSSAPVLNTPAPPPPTLHRSQSYCDRLPSMKELTRQCTTPKTTVMSIRAMELEALIDHYPHYTLHLTLTPKLCLDK